MATELPGTSRPGGRTERTRVAVLRATLDLLAEVGFTDLTVEAVAELSGVHKTTVYRRWESREGLVAAALRFGTDEPWSPADTGSFVADLRQMALDVVIALTSPGQRELPTAAVLAAFHSERAAEALREFYEDRHARAAVIVERAVARGEVPADTDPDEVTRTVCGPVFYRLFVSREPVSEETAEVAAEAGAAAARAGVLCRRVPGNGDGVDSRLGRGGLVPENGDSEAKLAGEMTLRSPRGGRARR